MRINNNLAALNTYGKMVGNVQQNGKSLEKLSSGLRINKAGDDAAGLSISEKMRGQIRGLDQASRNAQDSISMIQTAEGALGETESILQRMRELSVQSSNATNTDADREAIQDEVLQLKSEIDRIGNTTEFNTKKLLNGSLKTDGSATSSGSTLVGATVFKEVAASLTASQNFGSGDYSSVDLTTNETLKIDNVEITVDWDGKLTTAEQTLIDSSYSSANMTSDQKDQIKDALARVINESIDDYNTKYSANIEHVTIYESSANKLVIKSGLDGNGSEIAWGSTAGNKGVLTTYFNAVGSGSAGQGLTTPGYNKVVADLTTSAISFEINGVRLRTAEFSNNLAADTNVTALAGDLQSALRNAVSSYLDTASITQGKSGFINKNEIFVSVDDGRLTVKVGTESPIKFIENEGEELVEQLGLTETQTSQSGNGGLTFQIGANKDQTMNLGINDMRSEALGVGSIDVSSQSGAMNSIDTIDDAIAQVSAERSKLGAVQNRLEHTINNLSTSSENLTAAESRIRDVDMAKEMMQYTKTNILTQAAQGMLAQANQQPQGVLQLLR